MNEGGKELLRLRKWAHGLFVLLVLLVVADTLWEGFKVVYYVRVTMDNEASAIQLGPTDFLTIAAMLAYQTGMWIMAVVILRTLWTGETPFQMKNVRLMKALALVMALYVPCMRLLFYLQMRFTGRTVSSLNSWFSMPVMAAVVYSLALVFQYGVILQTQADETL